MSALTLDVIADWLRHRGGGMYGGEAVSQLEHALQCAALAQAEGAGSELVTAALLHDLGHLAEDVDDIMQPHERLGARLLREVFPPAVIEPIRLHVAAKRYLCAIDPLYWCALSDMSKRSLEWQGGAFSPSEAVEFIAQPYAEDAVRLRHWDDAAKVVGADTPPLDHFIAIMWSVSLNTQEST